MEAEEQGHMVGKERRKYKKIRILPNLEKVINTVWDIRKIDALEN